MDDGSLEIGHWSCGIEAPPIHPSDSNAIVITAVNHDVTVASNWIITLAV